MKNLNEIIKINNGVEKKWLIKNLIPMGEIAILYAQTNMFKTFLALKIALEVITGSEELGATESGRVYIFSPDTNYNDLILRIRGLTKANYLNQKEDILENLHINFDSDLDLTANGYGTRIEEYLEVEQVSYGTREVWKEREVLRTWDRLYYSGGLLIIDTLSQAIGESSINDDAAIRKSIKALKKIIKNAGEHCCEPLSILVIAHAGKNGDKGIMGSSLQKNDFPTVLKVRKKKNGQMELYREKIKCNAEGTSIPFKMRSTLIDNEETLYVDVGSTLTQFESNIIDYYKEGLNKDNIRDNIFKTHGQHYNNKKSFNVVFGRKWNSLIKQGFLDSEQHDSN